MIRRPPKSTPFPYPTLFRSTQVVNRLLRSGDNAADGCERLGEGRHHEVDLVVDAEVARGARAVLAGSEEHTSELQPRQYLVCRLLLEKKKHKLSTIFHTPMP